MEIFSIWQITKTTSLKVSVKRDIGLGRTKRSTQQVFWSQSITEKDTHIEILSIWQITKTTSLKVSVKRDVCLDSDDKSTSIKVSLKKTLMLRFFQFGK